MLTFKFWKLVKYVFAYWRIFWVLVRELRRDGEHQILLLFPKPLNVWLSSPCSFANGSRMTQTWLSIRLFESGQTFRSRNSSHLKFEISLPHFESKIDGSLRKLTISQSHVSCVIRVKTKTPGRSRFVTFSLPIYFCSFLSISLNWRSSWTSSFNEVALEEDCGERNGKKQDKKRLIFPYSGSPLVVRVSILGSCGT